MGKPSQENFYKRLNQLAGTNKSKVNEQNNGYGTLIDSEKSDDGTVYGIVKENHRYFIKKSNSQNESLDASDFAYIGGLENKHNYEYHSLSEAEKQRNMFIKSLNEAISLTPKKKSVNESKEEEKIDNPFSFIRNKITEGKTTIKSQYEDKFKSSMNENVEQTKKNGGLMPEAADIAVKKALGKLNEEAISTEDSEIKEKDEVANKKGKEKPQAPINDSNAKTEADKAMGHDSIPKKTGDSKSLAVNQEDQKLKEEASPLVTDDSEIIAGDSMVNKVNDKHEPAQAPINDTNAKAMADKATGKSAPADSAMPNDTEESEESEPFDDKEDKGDEKDDIVTEGAEKDQPFKDAPKKEKDISTEDSEVVTSDSVAQEKKVTTKPEAPYNNYNQPEKGQKEEKGEELKSKKEKGAIVVEGEDLSTADSEIVASDSPANDAKDPVNKHGKSLAVEDSEMEPEKSLANETKTDLPNFVDEAAEALKALTESEELTVADSEIEVKDSPVNKIHEDEVENELDTAAAALDDLEAAEAEPEVPAEPAPEVPAEEPAPEMPTADEPVPDMGGEEMPDMGGEPAPDAEVDVNVDAEVPAPEEGGEGEADEETKNEVKSLAGEIGELVRGKNFSNDDIVEIVNQLIEPFDTEKLSHNEQLKIQNKLSGDEGAGEDLPPEAAPEGGEEMGMDAGMPAEEPVVPEGEEMCAECGTFEGYAKSRGYDDLNECGVEELANLISGYAGAHGEGMNDGDFQGIAILLTPEVKDELSGYGHDDFMSQVEPFVGAGEEPSEEVGDVEVEVPVDIEGGEEEEDVKKKSNDVEEGFYDEIDMETVDQGIGIPDKDAPVDETENLDEIGWRDVKNFGAGVAGVGQKVGQKVGDKVGQAQQAVANKMQQGVDYVADKAKGVKQTYHKGAANRIVNDINQDATKLGQTIAKFNDQATKAGQQPISPQSIIMKMMSQLKQGGQTGFQHKFEGLGEGGEDFASMASDVDMDNPDLFNDDLKDATFAPVGENMGIGMHTGAMTESEKKVRNYVLRRLEEMAGKRKPTMNESQKPESLKNLDKKIAEQWELYKKQQNEQK